MKWMHAHMKSISINYLEMVSQMHEASTRSEWEKREEKCEMEKESEWES